MSAHTVAVVHELEHDDPGPDLVRWAATCTCGATAYGFPSALDAELWATRTHAQPSSIPDPTDRSPSR